MKESMSESLLKESILSLGDLGDYQRITSQRYTEVKQNNVIYGIEHFQISLSQSQDVLQ